MKRGPNFLLETHTVVWLWFHWNSQLSAALPSSLSGRYKSFFDLFELISNFRYQVSPPTTLAYLDSQVLFIGSHFGDSQLIRIHTSPISDTSTPILPIPADILTVQLSSFSSSRKGKERAWAADNDGGGRVLALNGTLIEVLDTWQNVGPILDAVLADTDGSGQVDFSVHIFPVLA
jgi:Mono-functional DNA-alkylating methyl methanesulfonate N-term